LSADGLTFPPTTETLSAVPAATRSAAAFSIAQTPAQKKLSHQQLTPPSLADHVKRSIPRACEKWLREEEEFVEVEPFLWKCRVVTKGRRRGEVRCSFLCKK